MTMCFHCDSLPSSYTNTDEPLYPKTEHLELWTQTNTFFLEFKYLRYLILVMKSSLSQVENEVISICPESNVIDVPMK